MGAADPTSGTVSLHEIIRSFGALLKSGWKPLRTGKPSCSTRYFNLTLRPSQLYLQAGMQRR